MARPGDARRIAVLFHENESPRGTRRYVIDALAQVWRAHGHEVIYLFGTHRLVPADIVLVHVDLSVVPAEYLRFARRYPIALNAWVSDIRKTRYSSLIVRSGETHNGPVMLKTDLNCSGYPEAQLGRWRRFRRLHGALVRRLGYRIFTRPAAVPRVLRMAPGLVMERFVPERENGFYVVRSYQFLGDRGTAMKLIGREPVVKGETSVAMEPIEPDPDIVELRNRMRFDYGKFDYVMHNGTAILLDANKTTGGQALAETPALLEMRRIRAEGLYWYFHHPGHWTAGESTPDP